MSKKGVRTLQEKAFFLESNEYVDTRDRKSEIKESFLYSGTNIDLAYVLRKHAINRFKVPSFR